MSLSNLRPLSTISSSYTTPSGEVLYSMRWYLLGTSACGTMALQYLVCTKLLGPIVLDTSIVNGGRVLGTSYELNSVHPSAPTKPMRVQEFISKLDYRRKL